MGQLGTGVLVGYLDKTAFAHLRTTMSACPYIAYSFRSYSASTSGKGIIPARVPWFCGLPLTPPGKSIQGV
jgi:hypothetical protein